MKSMKVEVTESRCLLLELLRLLFLAHACLLVAKSSDTKAAFTYMYTRKYIWRYRTFTYIFLCMSAYRCLWPDDDQHYV